MMRKQGTSLRVMQANCPAAAYSIEHAGASCIGRHLDADPAHGLKQTPSGSADPAGWMVFPEHDNGEDL